MPRKAGRGHPIIPLETLKRELAAGRSLREIARTFRVSRRAVQMRVARLKAADTIIAVVHPAHQEASARQQMHALDLFLAMVETKRKMLRAYERMAEDPDNPGEYCLVPRSDEYTIITEKTIEDENGKLRTIKNKMSLQDALNRVETGLDVEVVKSERRGADWRVEMRHLSTEIGNQMVQGSELKGIVSSTSAINAFMEALQECINEANEEVGRKIARCVAHKLMIILPEQQGATVARPA